MTGRRFGTDPAEKALMSVGFRHRIEAADANAAFDAINPLAGGELTVDAFHRAVAKALELGLIYDPVRLPEGALQCHWRLELTPAGVAVARADLAR